MADLEQPQIGFIHIKDNDNVVQGPWGVTTTTNDPPDKQCLAAQLAGWLLENSTDHEYEHHEYVTDELARACLSAAQIIYGIKE